MSVKKLRKNQPYRFVPVVAQRAEDVRVHPAGFHDGSEADKLSGVIRCTLTTHTPTLVGHFQYPAEQAQHVQTGPEITVFSEKDKRQVPAVEFDSNYWGEIAHQNRVIKKDSKSVVEPLFHQVAGDGPETRPVLLANTSIKGMLRQTIGAMTGAPMERVADNEDPAQVSGKARAFSVRPQLAGTPPGDRGFYQVTALDGVNPQAQEIKPLPIDWKHAGPNAENLPTKIPASLVRNFLLTNRRAYEKGPKNTGDRDISESDKIHVEYDPATNQIVSFGKIDQYRWASAHSTRKLGQGNPGDRSNDLMRIEASSPDQERIDGDQSELTGARLFFGYVDGGEQEQQSGGNGTLRLGIGNGDHARLAGRIAINHACEILTEDDSLATRFVKNGFVQDDTRQNAFNFQLPILSSPKPSAFWNYVAPGASDDCKDDTVNGWGDLPGVADTAHPLAGRKFYRRWEASETEIQEIDGQIRKGTQNQIARFVSKSGRKFRFELRFKDLTRAELGVLLLALSPHSFGNVPETGVAGRHTLWHAIGHGRPYGMGAVSIDIAQLRVLDVPSLALQPRDADWQQQAVRAGVALCEPDALQALWAIMSPGDKPDLNAYYGSPDAHSQVKVDYLKKSYGVTDDR